MSDLWWKSANIYELYVDKFAGTFKGLAERLDYVQELGINTLHILPHYASPMVDDGYDISDYRRVRPELGTLDDFDAFVESAHTRGIRVIIDFVLNHVSAKHPWFEEARVSKNSAKRDFFLWSETGDEFRGFPNPFIDFKPSNWIQNEATGDYYYATFYPEQPDLNWLNPEVQEAMFSHVDFWVDRGVDGFRLDAVPFLIKRGGSEPLGAPLVHEVVRTLRARLDARHQGRIALLAEVGQKIEEAKKYFGQGDECHLVYNFAIAEAMLYSLASGDIHHVKEEEEHSRDIPHTCAWAMFLRNHDDILLMSLSDEERNDLLRSFDPNGRFLFSKGRTTAVRLAEALDGDTGRILSAVDMLYSLPGAHVFYYGDEIGMRNLPPQKNVFDTREYVRGAFDWSLAEAMRRSPDSLLQRIAARLRRASGVRAGKI